MNLNKKRQSLEKGEKERGSRRSEGKVNSQRQGKEDSLQKQALFQVAMEYIQKSQHNIDRQIQKKKAAKKLNNSDSSSNKFIQFDSNSIITNYQLQGQGRKKGPRQNCKEKKTPLNNSQLNLSNASNPKPMATNICHNNYLRNLSSQSPSNMLQSLNKIINYKQMSAHPPKPKENQNKTLIGELSDVQDFRENLKKQLNHSCGFSSIYQKSRQVVSQKKSHLQPPNSPQHSNQKYINNLLFPEHQLQPSNSNSAKSLTLQKNRREKVSCDSAHEGLTKLMEFIKYMHDNFDSISSFQADKTDKDDSSGLHFSALIQKCIQDFAELNQSFNEVNNSFRNNYDFDHLSVQFHFNFFSFFQKFIFNCQNIFTNLFQHFSATNASQLQQLTAKEQKVGSLEQLLLEQKQQTERLQQLHAQVLKAAAKFQQSSEHHQADLEKSQQEVANLKKHLKELKDHQEFQQQQNDQLIKALANIKHEDNKPKAPHKQEPDQSELDNLKEKCRIISKENKDQKSSIQKMKERESKLMKLLSAIMEKGIDIESIYIDEVMNKKKDKEKGKRNKDYQDEIEEIPEMDEEQEMSSRNQLYSKHTSVEDEQQAEKESIFVQNQQNTPPKSLANSFNLNVKMLQGQNLPKISEKFINNSIRQKNNETNQGTNCESKDKLTQDKKELSQQANTFWEYTKKKTTNNNQQKNYEIMHQQNSL